MTKAIVPILMLILVACQTTSEQAKILKTLPSYKVNQLKPPIETRGTKIPPKSGKPTAVAKDNPAPFTGILLDGYQLAKYKLIKSERDKLREWIMIERHARHEVQDVQNLVLADALARAKRSWFESNKGTLGIVTGVVAACLLAIGLTYGLDKARE